MGLVTKDDGWRIPEELWSLLEPLLPPRPAQPLGCHNPRVPDRDAMNAILFVLRTGCHWNALNGTGICSSSSAHRRLLEWTEAGVFEKAWVRALNRYDKLVGIDWNWLSMDGAMSKAPWGGEKSGPNPTDRAKSGTKRSVITESAGIPLGLAVAGANVVDFKLARDTIVSIPIKRPRPTRACPQGVCLDKGYDYREVEALLREFRLTGHIARRGQNVRKLKRNARHKARRWVVERTHSWMNRFRPILVRWEKRADTYVALLHLVFALITWRACAAFA